MLCENPRMPHAVLTVLFLGVAGAVAGVIGTAGGITTLVAYPALLAVSIPPLAANVTNSVAMVGSGLSSASRAAPDITGQGPTIGRWMPVSITLSLAGAILLVVTPGGVFDRVVPFLVAAGSLTLLMQPRISRWQKENEHSWGRTAVFGGLGAVAVYSPPRTCCQPAATSRAARLSSPRVTALAMFSHRLGRADRRFCAFLTKLDGNRPRGTDLPILSDDRPGTR